MKPTVAELNAILADPTPTHVITLANGEIRAVAQQVTFPEGEILMHENGLISSVQQFWDAILSRAPSRIRFAAHQCREVGLDLSPVLQEHLTRITDGRLRLPRLVALLVFQEGGAS